MKIVRHFNPKIFLFPAVDRGSQGPSLIQVGLKASLHHKCPSQMSSNSVQRFSKRLDIDINIRTDR